MVALDGVLQTVALTDTDFDGDEITLEDYWSVDYTIPRNALKRLGYKIVVSDKGDVTVAEREGKEDLVGAGGVGEGWARGCSEKAGAGGHWGHWWWVGGQWVGDVGRWVCSPAMVLAAAAQCGGWPHLLQQAAPGRGWQ